MNFNQAVDAGIEAVLKACETTPESMPQILLENHNVLQSMLNQILDKLPPEIAIQLIGPGYIIGLYLHSAGDVVKMREMDDARKKMQQSVILTANDEIIRQ